MRYKKRKQKSMKFLIFLFGLGAFVVSLFVMIARTFFSIAVQPGSRQWEALIAKLRNKLEPVRGQLTPWDGKDMMPLLSLLQPGKSGGMFSDSIKSGMVNTIYQEPVVAIAEMQSGKERVLLARTSDREFVFRTKAKEVEIWMNGQPFGVLSGGSLLASGRNPKLLAQIAPSEEESLQLPVLMGNNTALTMVNPKHPPASPNPRALTLLRDLNTDEEAAALALAILYQARS